MNVIIKRPGEPIGHYEDIPNELQALQKIVDGHIEAVYIENGIILIVNEEGKLRNLPINFCTKYDIIVGTAIVCGQMGDEFDDCPISLESWQTVLSCWGNLISQRAKGVEA